MRSKFVFLALILVSSVFQAQADDDLSAKYAGPLLARATLDRESSWRAAYIAIRVKQTVDAEIRRTPGLANSPKEIAIVANKARLLAEDQVNPIILRGGLFQAFATAGVTAASAEYLGVE
jgi:hypothetical protein